MRFYFLLPAACVLLVTSARAQDADWPSAAATQTYTEARQYLSNGNFAKAIATYQLLITQAPGRMLAYRDLAQAYYYSNDYPKASETIEPMLNNISADEECFRIGAAAEYSQNNDKKAHRILENGISRFPHSGMLYQERGREYDGRHHEPEALKNWIDGIAAAPGYHLNYYEAARAYMNTDKPVWAALYGEIFVNLERATPRSNETRKLIMAAYKRMLAGAAAGKDGANKPADDFESAVQQTLLKNASAVSGDALTAENLTMLRTRFLTDWKAGYAAKYPFALFQYQDDLLRNGQFDAYNEWLFGRAENEQQYNSWVAFHAEAMPAFKTWQEAHLLQPAVTDNYNDGKVKNLFAK